LLPCNGCICKRPGDISTAKRQPWLARVKCGTEATRKLNAPQRALSSLCLVPFPDDVGQDRPRDWGGGGGSTWRQNRPNRPAPQVRYNAIYQETCSDHLRLQPRPATTSFRPFGSGVTTRASRCSDSCRKKIKEFANTCRREHHSNKKNNNIKACAQNVSGAKVEIKIRMDRISPPRRHSLTRCSSLKRHEGGD